MDNEFRYLTQFGTGTLAFDFLLDDEQYKKDKEAAGDAEWAKRDSNDRWLFYWGHSGSFAQTGGSPLTTPKSVTRAILPISLPLTVTPLTATPHKNWLWVSENRTGMPP